MPPTAIINSDGYNVGQGGYSSFHQIQLPGLGTKPGEDPAVNFRKGILFFFSKCELGSVSKKDVAKDIAGLAYYGENIDSAVKNANPTPQSVTLAAKVGDILQTVRSCICGEDPEAKRTLIHPNQTTYHWICLTLPEW